MADRPIAFRRVQDKGLYLADNVLDHPDYIQMCSYLNRLSFGKDALKSQDMDRSNGFHAPPLAVKTPQRMLNILNPYISESNFMSIFGESVYYSSKVLLYESNSSNEWSMELHTDSPWFHNRPVIPIIFSFFPDIVDCPSSNSRSPFAVVSTSKMSDCSTPTHHPSEMTHVAIRDNTMYTFPASLVVHGVQPLRPEWGRRFSVVMWHAARAPGWVLLRKWHGTDFVCPVCLECFFSKFSMIRHFTRENHILRAKSPFTHTGDMHSSF